MTALVAQLVSGTYLSCSGEADVCGVVRVMVHLLGYARVSTTEQNPDLQVDELTATGVLEGVDRSCVEGVGPTAAAR